jgi:hypothetical protein
VPEHWLEADWSHLHQVMNSRGFTIVNEHEHEFKNDANISVAFAKETVLIRDGILPSINEVDKATTQQHVIRTLTPQQFKQAYLFSEKDGYRRNTRGKKDREIIESINNYLAAHA